MSRRLYSQLFVTLVATLALSASAWSQIAIPETLVIEASDVVTAPGEEFTVSFHVDTEGPIIAIYASAFISTDELSVVSVQPGDGLEEYVSTSGPMPACELPFTVESVSTNLVFNADTPFDSSIHGTHLMTITYISDAGFSGTPFFSLGGWYTPTTSAQGSVVYDGGSILVTTEPMEEPFLRGDTNQDGTNDIADPVRLLEHLFVSPNLDCPDTGDWNDDGLLDLSDAVSLIGSLFSAGDFESYCRGDDEADGLAPCSFSSCP